MTTEPLDDDGEPYEGRSYEAGMAAARHEHAQNIATSLITVIRELPNLRLSHIHRIANAFGCRLSMRAVPVAADPAFTETPLADLDGGDE